MGRRRIPKVEGGSPEHARRLRHAIPDDSLDLHGFTVSDALSRTEFFLQRTARVHPEGVVRIITGRGLHSHEGPRLRDAVQDHLRTSPFARDFDLSEDGGSVLVRLIRG